MPARDPSKAGTVERRSRAAAELAGLTWDQLARRLNSTDDTLTRRVRAVDWGLPLPGLETPKSARERIAEACGLPYEFFTVDFNRLRSGRPHGLEAIDNNGGR